MWSVKVISGELAGKVFPLKPGTNVIGRGRHCDISLGLPSVSKEHARIEVYQDKVIITDLNSRNGTFVNGVQIKSHKINPNDRISLFDVFIEVTMTRTQNLVPFKRPSEIRQEYGNLAYQQQSAEPFAKGNRNVHTNEQMFGFVTWLRRYVDEVVLPGVYKLSEWFEFRWVIGFFVLCFIVAVTALSTIPLMRILKASVEQESQRRALTIARILADQNRAPLSQGLTYGGVTVEVAEREPGVTKAYIISNDNGSIVAPANLVGQAPSEAFVHDARKIGMETVQQIDDDTIGALVPVRFYNPAFQADTIVAHAVVIYDMGSLAVGDARVLSLFVQILFIAVILGALLYFFLIKSIEEPISDLREQVTTGLRDGRFNLASKYQFPLLADLISDINSALNRRDGVFGQNAIATFESDRTAEIRNVLNLVGFPALAILPSEKMVVAVNDHFQIQLSGSQNWNRLKLDQVLDQALKLNLQQLADKVAADPDELATDELEIGNANFDLAAQGVRGTKDLAYILVVFTPRGGGI